MRALFDDVAFLHHKDQVSVFNGRKPMSDHEAGSVLCQRIHSLLRHQLRPCIDRAGRFVQDHHWAVFDHGTSNGKELLLPCGNDHIFSKHGIKAIRKRLDKVIDPTRTAGLFKFFVRNPCFVVNEIFTHGSVKQPGVLQHHAKQLVDVFSCQIGGRNTVNADIAADQIKEPHQKVDHCCLTGTCRTDDSDFLPRLDVSRKIFDNDFVRIIRIAEANMVEFDLAMHLGQFLGLIAFIRKFFLLQEVEYPISGGCRLHLRHTLCQCAERGGKQADKHDKCRDYAKGDLPIHNQSRTDHTDRYITEIADHIHQRLHNAG